MIEVKSWDGMSQKTFHEILEEFSEKIKKDVVVEVPHKKRSGVKPMQNKFRICIWSAPNTRSEFSYKKNLILRMWGKDVSCKDPQFEYSELGIPINAPEGIVGELIESNLFIFHDAVHYGNKAEVEILEKILDETALAIIKYDGEKPYQRYVRFMKNLTTEQSLKKKRNELSSKEEKLKEIEKSFVKIRREINETKKIIEALNSQSEKELKREFEIFCKNNNFQKISFAYSLTCETNEIRIVRNKKTYNMGRFRITISRHGEVAIISMDNKKHPHISEEGKPCFGNIKLGILKLIGDNQFLTAAIMIRTWLETYNPKDRYRVISEDYVEKGEESDQ